MIKITKAGYFYISLTIILGFSAVNTANNLVYIIAAAMLSFMAVSGFFGRSNLRGISVAIDVPEEIYARRPDDRGIVRELEEFLTLPPDPKAYSILRMSSEQAGNIWPSGRYSFMR